MEAAAKLNEMPLRCRLYEKEPWHSKGLRVLPVDNYLLLYLPVENKETVAIIRIMYGGRDIEKRLKRNRNGGSSIVENYDIIKTDFNEIAELGSDPKWNHNNCYFPYLLRHIPLDVRTCLDIGYGKGELTALLAKKANKVIAVDLSDKMIEYARSNNAAENIEYICGNILYMDFAPSSFDIIISTATAHHLPYDWLLEFAKDKLCPGGKLILLDLAKAHSITDYMVWGFAALPNVIMSLIKNGRLHKDDPHATEVWRKHGEHDSLMTLREIRSLAAKHIPGATVRRKLFWRYSLIWEKK